MSCMKNATAVAFGLTVAVLLLLVEIAPAVPAPPGPLGYRVMKTITVGGDGSWDYLTVDSAARRLYVTRATHVLVMDADIGTIVGDVPDTQGVHGVAIAAEFARGFTSNGGASTATIFDLKTLKTIGTVKTGAGPDGILYDPVSKRVFTFNHGSNDVTAIAAADGTVAGTLVLGDRPEAAVADGRGSIFVNIPGKAQIVEFDSRKLTELHRWPLPCQEPSPLAMDLANRRLFSACEDRTMVIVNADNGKVVATAPIGAHVDAADFDPEAQLVLVSSGEGTLAVIHEESPDKYKVIDNVPTKVGARTLALDPRNHQVFLAAADFDPPLPGQKRPTIRPNTFVILAVGSSSF
jgi:DNA-binding beta-propeller fold protein YncE